MVRISASSAGKWLGIAVLVGASIAGGAAESMVAYVNAPPSAKGKWSMAMLSAEHKHSTAGGAHGTGTAWEEGKVTLSVSGLPEAAKGDRSVIVAAESHPLRLVPWNSESRKLAAGPFKLKASEDGQVLALSWDGGKTWTFALPSPFLYCPHGVFRGSASELRTHFPEPRDLVLEVLRSAGPLGKGGRHSGCGDSLHGTVSQQEACEREFERAVRWVALHPQPDAVLVEAVMTGVANASLDLDSQAEAVGGILTAWLKRAPGEGDRVKRILANPLHATPRNLGLVAGVLVDGNVLGAQEAIGAALEGLVPGYPADPEAAGGYAAGLKGLAWNLGRAVTADRRVSPGAERSALAILGLGVRLLQNEAPSEAHPDPWSRLASHLGFAARYAVVVLGLSRTPTALAGLAKLPCARERDPVAWPHPFPRPGAEGGAEDQEVWMSQTPQVSDWIWAARRGRK